MTYPFPDILIEKLRTAQRVAVLTGAGISAESGVPTFRQAQTGLWAQYDPEELATPRAFRQNPKLVWEWYAWRRELVAQAQPNSGHFALVEMEKRVPYFTLITQNVDGLHPRAGSQNVVALHGDITRTKCFDDGRLVTTWPDTDQIPPRCPRCDGMLRPDVVWFGEGLPPDALGTAVTAARSCDLFLSIGTSALVQPAASLPIEALNSGAFVVEINLNETPLTPHIHLLLKGASGVALPKLIQAVWEA